MQNEKLKCMIIAEAGVNHNGNLDIALKLCDEAKKVGADVVKFQTWKTEKIITQSVAQADYQITNTKIKESQFDMLKRLELSYDDFRKIKEHCDKIGIVFASTADDEKSLDFLVELGIPFIKIGSGDVGNIPFLRYIGSKNLPIIMSTGMSNLADVDVSINALRQGGAQDISILHCTTNYPCPYAEVNLKAMLTLKEAFHLPVGYSDHTIGNAVAISAVTLGACVIEKHFTLDHNMTGPDHLASTEPQEFAELVKAIRQVESYMGDGIKKATCAEEEISKVVTKRIVALKNIEKGEIFSKDNLCVKRNDVGLEANLWDLVLNKKAKKNFGVDEGILL